MTSTFEGLGPILVTSISSVVTAAAKTTKHPQLGTRKIVAGNEYVYVYNGGGSQIDIGKVGVAMIGCTEFTCTVSAISGDVPLGCCLHATLTTDTYGWLLSKGYGVAFANSTTVVGSPIQINSNGSVNSANTFSPWGRALSGLAAGTKTGPVFWQCP